MMERNNTLANFDFHVLPKQVLTRCHSSVCRASDFIVPLVDSRERLVAMEDLSQLGQMKMVLCGTPSKITLTILGLRSLPPTEREPSITLNTTAYVKISLCPDEETRTRHRTTSQYVINGCVTLHENFAFDIGEVDFHRRILISAWCRNVSANETTFVGCMSFGVRGIIANQEVVQGWFYFLRENLGRRKHLKVKLGNPGGVPALSPTRSHIHKATTSRLSAQQGNHPNDLRYSTLPTRGRHSARLKKLAVAQQNETFQHKVYAGCQCMYCKKGDERTALSAESKQKRRHSPYSASHGVKRQKMPGDCDVTEAPTSRGAILRDAKTGNVNMRRETRSAAPMPGVGASPKLKQFNARPESPLELKCASVRKTELRSARIVAPSALRTAQDVHQPHPTPEDTGYQSEEAEKENRDNVEVQTDFERDDAFRTNSAAWDIFPTPARGRKAGRLSLDAGLNALHEFRSAAEGLPLGSDVIREEAVEEKSKIGRLFAFRIQRKTDMKQEANNPTPSNFKRSSSLRRSKRDSCENCFCSSSSLAHLLSRKGGTNAFRGFLQSEFSEENLEFWLECESFKRVKGSSKIHKMATKIYSQFLVVDSPSEINLDSSTREEVKSSLDCPSVDMFDQAQDRIFKLMSQDSFRRFLVSEFAHRCKTSAHL